MVCPICKCKDKLYVDEKFEKFLMDHPGSEELTFTASGEAIPYVAPTNLLRPRHVSVVDITSPSVQGRPPTANPLDIPRIACRLKITVFQRQEVL